MKHFRKAEEEEKKEKEEEEEEKKEEEEEKEEEASAQFGRQFRRMRGAADDLLHGYRRLWGRHSRPRRAVVIAGESLSGCRTSRGLAGPPLAGQSTGQPEAVPGL